MSLSLSASLTAAEQVPPYLALERWSRLDSSERERLLSRMRPERRKQMEERLQRFESQPAEVRERLRQDYDHFQQLSPEKQEEVRKLFRRYSEVPVERRAELRRELVRLRRLSPENRIRRVNSGQFRLDFNESEQELLAGLSELLSPLPRPAERPRSARPRDRSGSGIPAN